MQTFLPYPSFDDSVTVLDSSRQNKQILECRQIVNVLYKKHTGQTVKGWANHPAVTMWEGYEQSLYRYSLAANLAYKNRTKKEHQAFLNMETEHGDWLLERPDEDPDWLGADPLHSSHRQRLLHKGMLDVCRKLIRERFPNSHKGWIKRRFGKELRDLIVREIELLCRGLQVDYEQVLHSSHYAQFNWKERPSDDYIWPRDLCDSK